MEFCRVANRRRREFFLQPEADLIKLAFVEGKQQGGASYFELSLNKREHDLQ